MRLQRNLDNVFLPGFREKTGQTIIYSKEFKSKIEAENKNATIW
jgi:hypothetical protein